MNTESTNTTNAAGPLGSASSDELGAARLKPECCPFCGSRDVNVQAEHIDDTGWTAHAACGACDAHGPAPHCWHHTEYEAIEEAVFRWNRTSAAMELFPWLVDKVQGCGVLLRRAATGKDGKLYSCIEARDGAMMEVTQTIADCSTLATSGTCLVAMRGD